MVDVFFIFLFLFFYFAIGFSLVFFFALISKFVEETPYKKNLDDMFSNEDGTPPVLISLFLWPLILATSIPILMYLLIYKVFFKKRK